MADVFGEVDDDLRADQVRAVAKRYGLLIVAMVVLAVIGVGIWQYLVWQRAKADARLSADYFGAMHDAEKASPTDPAAVWKESLPAFKHLTTVDEAGIRALSRLRVAQMEADTGNLKGAIADLDGLAGDPRAPAAFRDLATLVSVQRQLTTANLSALALRLQGIDQPGAPFRALALETSAMIDLARGKLDSSRHTLQALLADENATDAIRERANTLLQAIAPSAARG